MNEIANNEIVNSIKAAATTKCLNETHVDNLVCIQLKYLEQPKTYLQKYYCLIIGMPVFQI